MANITPFPYTGRKYDYEYFTGSVPPEVFTDPKYAIDTASINVSQLKNENKRHPDGYFWNYRNGDLSTNSNLNEMTEKVILIVNGNLTINSDLVLSNLAAMAFIVSGDVLVDKNVDTVSGAFLATGKFDTAYNGNKNNKFTI